MDEPDRTVTGDEAVALTEAGLTTAEIQRLLYHRWQNWLRVQDAPRKRRVARRKRKEIIHV